MGCGNITGEVYSTSRWTGILNVPAVRSYKLSIANYELRILRCGELNRQPVFDAIRHRRCYAASGERILIHGTIAERDFGEELGFADLNTPPRIEATIAAKNSISRIDLVRNGITVHTVSPASWKADFRFEDTEELDQKKLHSSYLKGFVTKNGCMLLNVLQRPDGTIDEETVWILEELSGWFAVCGEAIYDTRPWRQFGEGVSEALIAGFKEETVDWNSADIRFTCKGNTVYAFLMRPPESRVAVLKSLTESERVASVRLLGTGEVPFEQNFGILTARLPEKLPTSYVNVLAIEMA